VIAVGYLFGFDIVLTTCSVFYQYSTLNFTDLLTTTAG
jgi:hypothetical protein